jgi:uncharacterized protein
MSRENVEIVTRMYDAYARGDFETSLSCFDREIVMDATHRVDGVVGHGHEELVTILAEWIGTWDEWREQVEEVRDVGDRVVVISTQRGRGKGSGVEWEGRFGMVYEVKGGKITRWTVFDDPHKALEAVGLSD